MSARACICRWSPCFSRPTGSILGLYTAQPLPHLTALAPPSCLGMYLSGVSKLLSCLVMYLLPHVSGLLRPPCFTPAFQAAWSCIFNIRGFETATWHVLARLEKPKKTKNFKQCKTSPLVSARACICRRPSCFSRPTGSILGLYTAQPLPHLTALAPPSCLGMYLSGVSKLLSCLVKYLLHHVSGLLRPPCLTPAFQGAWSCIFKGFRNCYVARFSQA